MGFRPFDQAIPRGATCPAKTTWKSPRRRRGLLRPIWMMFQIFHWARKSNQMKWTTLLYSVHKLPRIHRSVASNAFLLILVKHTWNRGKSVIRHSESIVEIRLGKRSAHVELEHEVWFLIFTIIRVRIRIPVLGPSKPLFRTQFQQLEILDPWLAIEQWLQHLCLLMTSLWDKELPFIHGDCHYPNEREWSFLSISISTGWANPGISSNSWLYYIVYQEIPIIVISPLYPIKLVSQIASYSSFIGQIPNFDG